MWTYIQQVTNKFCVVTDHVVSRKVSGLGVVDVVRAQPASFVQSNNALAYHQSLKLRVYKCPRLGLILGIMG
jgi:hypothetical protein